MIVLWRLGMLLIEWWRQNLLSAVAQGMRLHGIFCLQCSAPSFSSQKQPSPRVKRRGACRLTRRDQLAVRKRDRFNDVQGCTSKFDGSAQSKTSGTGDYSDDSSRPKPAGSDTGGRVW